MSIFESTFDPIVLRDVSITDRVFEGLRDRPNEVRADRWPHGPHPDGGAVHRSGGIAGWRSDGARLWRRAPVALMAPNCPESAVVFHAVA